jgi:exonuclease III
MTFSTWKVRSLYGTGFLMAAARKLARHKLDLVGVQEVRWDKECTVRARNYNFVFRNGDENHQLGTGFFFLFRIVLAVKRVEFVSGRMSYIQVLVVLRGRWCYIFFNVHAPNDEKSEDKKESFYKKLKQVSLSFSKVPYENSNRRF